MAHLHEVRDSDTHFKISGPKLEITNVSEIKPLMQKDHAAEVYTFEMPRYFEGHDMSLCNKVEVHYNNIKYDSSTRETTTNKSFDEVEYFKIAPDDEDAVIFSWKIKGDATQLDGTLSFCIRFACLTGDIVDYQKFTQTFTGVPVGASIFNTEEVAKQYADVLEAWRREFITAPNLTAEIGQTIKVKVVDESGKPTEWEAVKFPTKLSDLENDLYYSKAEEVMTLTKDDATIYYFEDENGNPTEEVDRWYLKGTPKFEWFKNIGDFKFKLVVNFDGITETFTDEDMPLELYEKNSEYLVCGNNALYLCNGLNDEIGDIENSWSIYVDAPLEFFVSLTIYKVDAKKVPIEYCDTSEIEAEIDALAEEVWDL